MATEAQEEVVDAQVVTDEPQAPEQAAPQSLALAPRQRRSEVIRPLDAGALVESFAAYQELLPRLLDASDWQSSGRDRFVKKSGWRKIATAFDLDVIRVSETVERDADGTPIRAMAVYRAIAPSGRSMDGDGYCSVDESRFQRSGGRQKLENDLRATATTRAKNRAIADLVGMGAVSAEEVDSGGSQQAPAIVEASPELKQTVRNVLSYLLDGDPRATAAAFDGLHAQFGGRLPRDAGQAVVIVGASVKAHADLVATGGVRHVPQPEDDPDAPGGQFDMDDARAEAAS